MRKLLILAVLGLGLIACDKEKTEEKSTDVVVSADGTTQDSVQPAEDVTASVDVTSTTSPAADVTVTD